MKQNLVRSHSRTTNVLLNFFSSFVGQMIVIISNFIVRTFFIKFLGKEYLGIDGLFSNILSLLSLTELGVGSAILFKLYQPISQNNISRIIVLMKFYKTAYRYIGTVVALIGVCLIPFLPVMIKDYNRLIELQINPIFIFLLYLLNSVSSYMFLAYKSAIVKAHQREYFLNIVSYGITIMKSIVQCTFLLLFKSFELYIALSVSFVIIQNCVYAIVATREYPYIKIKTKEKLDKTEVKEIIKDCTALLFYKLNTVVLKATDNIVLSVFKGLDLVALYSNYNVFYTTIQTLFSKIFNSISHSLGNLHAIHDLKHEYSVFCSTNFITCILGGTAFVGIFAVSDEFIIQWIGEKWTIPQPFAFILGIEIYTLAIRSFLSKYRATMGLFQQAKYRPLLSMLINVVLSVLLVTPFGISGVVFATIVADWSTLMWYDPIIIHKYGFNNLFSYRLYFMKNAQYFALILLIGMIDFYLCKCILAGYGWLSIIFHAVICAATVPGILILFFHKTNEGRYLIQLINRYLKKIRISKS